ncbi:hypothetical protein EBU94_02010 [bacterium]|nr:hypothetical protein [bacterium]
MDKRIDLSDVAFIIPFHASNKGRIKSLCLTLYYLLSNFKTNIYLKEISGSAYLDFVVPYLKNFNIENNVEYFYSKEGVEKGFHKTKILNDLLLAIDKNIVVMNDADCILPIQSYVSAVEKIKNGADLVLPYFQGENCLAGLNADLYINNPSVLSSGVSKEISQVKKIYNELGCTGGIHFHNFYSYIAAYMENENMIGYGPEDTEKLERFARLGYKIERVNNFICHFNHPTESAYRERSVSYIKNHKILDDLRQIPNHLLSNHYKNEQYYRERMVQFIKQEKEKGKDVSKWIF